MIDLLKNISKERPKDAPLLGLDVGKKTIGLALSHPGQNIVTPLETIKRTKFTRDMAVLATVIAEYEVGGFVIGLPVNMDGREGPRAQSIRDFAMEFEKFLLSPSFRRRPESRHSGQPDPGFCRDDSDEIWIALWDERLSTVSVEESVDNLVDKRKTKVEAKSSGLIDKLAAQVILQGALDYLSRS